MSMNKEVLFAALKEKLRGDIGLMEFDLHINDPEYAEHVAE